MAPPLDHVIERPEVGDVLLETLLAADAQEIGLSTALHGAGGFGKTTLAAWACHRPEVYDFYRGGLLWLTIGQETRDAALAERINDLAFVVSGRRPSIADPLIAGAELGRLLDERDPLLLVLDDVWHESQLRPFRVGGGRCTRLVTTRVPDLLPPAAARFLVDVMSPEQARLVITQGITDFPAGRADALAAACGRWPVLLGLVNRVLRRRTARGEASAEAVDWVLGRLTAQGPAALDPSRPADRAQAVAATVEASLGLLSPAGRARCLDLAIFPEDVPIPLTVLSLLWPGDVEAACEELTSVGLIADYRLDAPGPRLLLHDVIRSYLRTCLTDEASVHVRLVRGVERLVGDKWWDLPAEAEYLWRFLPYHVHKAGLPIEPVSDLRWVAAKTLHQGSLVGALTDLELGATPAARALRSVLAPVARLFGPIDPATAIGATLASRVRGVEGLEEVYSAYRRTLPRPRLEPAWPLPDREASVGHTGGVTDCAFSPDGTLLATSSDDQTVRLWHTPDGTARGVLEGHSGGIWTCAFSPDGTLLATGGDDHTVRLWRVSDATPQEILVGHRGLVGDCAFSPDATLLATVSTDGSARLWSVPDGACVAVLMSHAGPVTCCAFSPDGMLLATAGHDRIVRLWSVRDRRLLVRLHGHTDRVQGCSFSADGLLATVGADSMVRLWDTRDGSSAGVLTGHRGFVTDCQFAPDGRLATTGHDETVRLWRDGVQFQVWSGHTAWIRRCAFSRDGGLMATAAYDGTARIWRTADGTSSVLSAQRAWVRGCAFSPDGRLLATASDDLTARVLRIEDGVEVASLSGHGGRVNGCAFSPDSAVLATSSSDGIARLWRSGSPEVELTGHTEGVNGCRFSPDGRLLATPSDDRTVRLWRARDGEVLTVLRGHADRVNDCAFSPDGARVISGGNDGTVRVWRDGRPEMVLEGHTDVVNGCAFAPAGSMIASSSDDGTIILWDLAAAAPRAVLRGHTSWVDRCAFSPDGAVLASASNDGTVRVWDVTTAACLAALRVAGPVTGIAWHPGGGLLATGGGAGAYLLRYT